jgi:uroporphyrin-III C-methyltransferase
VIYMGVQRLAHIQDGLLAALSAHTPAALVQHASTAQERRLVTTLGQLAADAAQAGIGSPAILIVGDVLQGVQAVSEAAEPMRQRVSG